MQRFLFIPAALLMGALIAVGCTEKQPAEPEQIAFSMSDNMLKKVTFHKADSSEVKNELRFFGKIAADNNKLAQVYPIVSGVVKSIAVELGDYVQQGQVLASIESSEVAEFQKEMLNALSEVAIAEKNLAVARDLFAGKLNSEKDVAVAEKELEKAKAELTRITEIYKIYSLKNGSIYNVTAPISGFIVNKKINQNEQIRPDISEPLFSIAEINEVWALANITESDIAKVQVGYEADIRTLAFPDSVYRGKIDKIFNAIDPETKSMKVRVRIPNKNLMLKPEMNCTVSVRFSEKKKMICVPSAAVIFDKNKYWVMVFKDRYNIETRQVEPYRQLPDVTYLSAGLNAGEQVIVKNALLVYDALND
ncbi:MAG: efflux RND transporter periplasmic adaptor subunit [Cytophagales bacterium]|nr:efflux RND transporter periplasmic adaptor subunit [Bernardetiaceae bacterium]MDW8204082.1 efflux RND transporter periplasmic adaptor subunit [Cytophagales bacterium]